MYSRLTQKNNINLRLTSGLRIRVYVTNCVNALIITRNHAHFFTINHNNYLILLLHSMKRMKQLAQSAKKNNIR